MPKSDVVSSYFAIFAVTENCTLQTDERQARAHECKQHSALFARTAEAVAT